MFLDIDRKMNLYFFKLFLDNKQKKCVGQYRGFKYKLKCCCYRNLKKKNCFRGGGGLKIFRFYFYIEKRKEKKIRY